VDIRDSMSDSGGRYKLFPYAKDLWYRPDIEVIGMTLEIYDESKTYQYSFAFEVDDKLERFLSVLEEI
jgi:hypothetical protein